MTSIPNLHYSTILRNHLHFEGFTTGETHPSLVNIPACKLGPPAMTDVGVLFLFSSS